MPLPSSLLAPGTIVADRYRIEALLGQGGFGAVFRATQLNLDREVALKVLLPDALGDDGIGRFQREAAIVQQLDHPNVVRLLDFGRGAGGEPYLAFELLRGQTLEEALRAGGPLSTARAGRVAVQVLKALMEAHARGVVHRDVKPANLFLCTFQGEADYVKVLDFGIAKGADSRTLTQRGSVVGTPAYMAPEQVDGGQAGFATDLFALGLTLAEAITGRPVFEGASLVDIVREHLSPTPVPLAPTVLQSPLGPVIHRATQKVPARRYPSAAEMLAHVEAVLRYTGQSSVSAAPTGAAPLPPHLAHAPTSAAPLSPHLGVAPTSPPQAVSAPGGYPLVPPAPPRPSRRRGGSRAALAAVGGGLLLAAAVLGVVALTGGATTKKAANPAASARAAPEAGIGWLGARDAYSVIDADVNGDGVLDFIAFCTDPVANLCAVDGATFRTLWRKPVRLDRTKLDKTRLVTTGRALVYVDPQGVAHVLDLKTGAEQGAIRLENVAWVACAPPELPGKVWLQTTDEAGVVLDVTTRATTAATKAPGSCREKRFPTESLSRCDELANPRGCPRDWLDDPARSDVTLEVLLSDRTGDVGFGHKRTDSSSLIAVGFSPGAPSSAPPRWQRPLGPGNGETALELPYPKESALGGGRAAAVYIDTARREHLVCLDVSTGRTLWDFLLLTPAGATLPGGGSIRWIVFPVLTPTRAFVGQPPRLDVLDATTGRLLGGIGPRE
jgi:hypothetical protein